MAGEVGTLGLEGQHGDEVPGFDFFFWFCFVLVGSYTPNLEQNDQLLRNSTEYEQGKPQPESAPSFCLVRNCLVFPTLWEKS